MEVLSIIPHPLGRAFSIEFHNVTFKHTKFNTLECEIGSDSQLLEPEYSHVSIYPAEDSVLFDAELDKEDFDEHLLYESEDEEFEDELDLYCFSLADDWEESALNHKTTKKQFGKPWQRPKKVNHSDRRPKRKYVKYNQLSEPNRSKGYRRYPQICSFTPEGTVVQVSAPVVEYPTTRIKPRAVAQSNPSSVDAGFEHELQRAIQESLLLTTSSNPASVTLECGLTAQQIQDLASRELTPEDYELLSMLDEQVAPKTVSSDVFSSFPTSTFSKDKREVFSDCCSICMCEYEEGEQLKTIPVCSHTFHSECLQQWLLGSSRNCPLDGISVSE